jgi:DegV family protein with EDD domain
MQIVTDAGADFTPVQTEGLAFHTIPLTFTLDGKTYRSGVDIEPTAFYDLIASTQSFPTTSQPAPGEFAETYRRLAAAGDPEILSIHISSGLSGTLGAAQVGAQQTPEAHVTFVDTLTLSGAQGWQVEAACRMTKAGWPLARILAGLERVRAATEIFYTLETLRYLEHGGRISHLQALLGQILNMKPVIGVEKEHGTYVVHARERSMKSAVKRIIEIIAQCYQAAGSLRVQVLHGHNAPAAADLMALIGQRFSAHFLPIGPIAPVLGAHTGPGLVGVVVAPMSAFEGIPGMA